MMCVVHPGVVWIEGVSCRSTGREDYGGQRREGVRCSGGRGEASDVTTLAGGGSETHSRGVG